METFFLKLLMWLELGLYKLVDKVLMLFNVFAGLSEVNVKGDSENTSTLLWYFLNNDTVLRVFWWMFVLGVFLAGLFTVIAIVKNMVTVKKAVAKTVGKFIGSIFAMIAVVGVMFLGIYGSNEVLGAIDTAFKNDTDLTISEKLLEAAIGESFAYNPDTGKKYEYKDIKAKYGSLDNLTADILFGITTTSNIFEKKHKPYVPKSGLVTDEEKKADIEQHYKETYNSKDEYPLVEMSQYDFLLGLFSSCVIAVCMLFAAVGLCMRLFDLVFLLLTSPLLVATVPLDDGAKFKLWRETCISKCLLAYGTVFAINIFILIIPLIDDISVVGSAGNVVNTILKTMLIVCGAISVSYGQILFSRLFGTSAEESRQATHGMRMIMGGAIGTMHMAKGAGKMVFGAHNPYTGKRDGGIAPGAKRIGTKIFNAGGAIYNGKTGNAQNAYGNAKSKIAAKMKNAGGIKGGVKRGQEKRQKKRDLRTPHEPPAAKA